MYACAVARDRTFAESSSTDKQQHHAGSKKKKEKKCSNRTAFRSGRRQVKNALALILLGCSRRSCNHDAFIRLGGKQTRVTRRM